MVNSECKLIIFTIINAVRPLFTGVFIIASVSNKRTTAFGNTHFAMNDPGSLSITGASVYV